MFDPLTSYGNVTSGVFMKRLQQKAVVEMAADALERLRIAAKENCSKCYGRGYDGMQGDRPIACRCTTKTNGR